MFTLVADVKPLPEYARLMGNADIGYGEKVGSFNVWPTARPALSLERGKPASISLRIKPDDKNAALKLAADAPASYRLSRNASGVYWLDISIEPINEPGARAIPVLLDAGDGHTLAVKLTVTVAAENLIVTPRELDLGQVALSSLIAAPLRNGRLGVRKLVGSFHIKSVSSTLEFLKLDQQTIVDGSNYLIRVGVKPELAKAGAHTGVIRIETDEGQVIEAPVKLVISGQ